MAHGPGGATKHHLVRGRAHSVPVLGAPESWCRMWRAAGEAEGLAPTRRVRTLCNFPQAGGALRLSKNIVLRLSKYGY